MIEIIISFIALLIIFLASIYFYFDIKKHKEENISDLLSINNSIDAEKEDRLSNLKYVVDQVNTTNQNMDTEYNINLNNLKNKQELFEKGVSSLMQPKNATGSVVPFSLLNATTSPTVNLELINHVSSIGGMTIKDLHGSKDGLSKSLMACGTGVDSSKCIKFPDENGDTYLTSVVTGKSIVAGAPLITKDVSIDGTLTFKNGETSFMQITPDKIKNTAYFSTNDDVNLNLMSNNLTNITGKNTLNLLSDPTSGKIIISANTADASAVSEFKLPQKISITKNSLNSLNSSNVLASATIELNENNDLVIRPPVGKKVIINGNLDVSGNIASTNGNIVTTSTNGNIYSENNINAKNNIYANTGVVQAKLGKVLGTNIAA
jgi:hypothetical protein